MQDEPQRPQRGRGLIPLFAVVLGILFGLLAAVSWFPLRAARAEWRAGRLAESVAQSERWSRLHIWPNQYHQMLAVAYLSAGNRAAAGEHLDALRGKRLWISLVPRAEVATRLFSRGAHDDFLNYDATVRGPASDEAPLHRAAALAALHRLEEARKVLRTIDRKAAGEARVAALERAIAQRLKGSFPYVLDRHGGTIAAFEIASRDLVAVNRDFSSLVEGAAGALTIESQIQRLGLSDLVETTLDPAVQKAAIQALGGARGALVAIDPSTQEILALASSRGTGSLANLALEKQYEPGSVVKVLTGLGAFEHGVELDFPYSCRGSLVIDGRNFGDWLEGGHGSLPDFDEALARSCNVVFADLGVRLGADRLRAVMTRAGFDSNVNLGVAIFPLGRTVGRIFNKFETGFYAIGVEHQTATVLHLAMLAAMIANRGELTTPRLVRGRRSIFGEPAGMLPPTRTERVVSAKSAERMTASMVAVVERAAGTGRRASIDGVSLAMKTGTAGADKDGYHAVILAFAPAEQPKIAFAIIAEDSGPAEFAGARIAREFLEAIAGRLR